MAEIAQPESFLVRFEGALHTVEANTLVGAVVGYSTALYKIAEAIDAEASIQVRVAAPERGSFEFAIEVAEFVAVSASTIAMFGSHGYSVASQVIDNWAGLLKLLKHLRGEKPKEASSTNNGILIENGEGATMLFTGPVVNIYNDSPGAVDALASAFRAIEDEPTIDGVEILKLDGEDHQPEQLFSADREEFEAIASSGEAARPDTRIEVVLADIYPVKFVTEPGIQWSGYYKGNKIRFSIRDKEFYDDIVRRRFGFGDLMVVELEIAQQLDSQIGIYINKSYTVRRVREYREQPRGDQASLFKSSPSRIDEDFDPPRVALPPHPLQLPPKSAPEDE